MSQVPPSPDAQTQSDIAVGGLPAVAPIDPRSLSPGQRASFCRAYLDDRQRGRTDLLWLCNEILQYKDVDPEVHGPVIQNLQSFYGREEYMDDVTFDVVYSYPRCPLHEDQSCAVDCAGRTCWYLPGPRFRMLLDPRGHLKTTVNTIAHGIQWIINFTDIRIALSVATSMQGSDIITEVENHFRYNEKFRFLYPEFCPPPERTGDWGSKEQFTVPNRQRKWLKEPTMRVISVGKVVAGPHYEVEKHSDLVDKENVKTPGGIKEVKEHFKYMMPLLERGPDIPGRDRTVGWVDLEGTIYDHSDLYCEELDKDARRAAAGQPCRWAVFKRDAVAEPVDEKTMWRTPFRTLWPKRFPWHELRAIYEDMDDYTFNCQYRLNPTSKSMSLATKNEIGFFPAQFKKQLLPRCYMKTTIDLAGLEEDADGCNIAIVTVGHMRDGRKMVFEALVGHPSPFEIIEYCFALDLRYAGGIAGKLTFQGEDAHHMNALMPFISREMELRQRYLNFTTIPRDPNTAKDNRIFYGLQPWFRRRLIWFADDISCLPHIVDEITKFPKFKFKDFLDALVDQGQTKDGDVDQLTSIPGPKNPVEDYLHLRARFVGFHPVTKAPMYSDGTGDDTGEVFGDGPDNGIDAATHERNIIGAL